MTTFLRKIVQSGSLVSTDFNSSLIGDMLTLITDCGGSQFHDIYSGENYRVDIIDISLPSECDGVSLFRSSSFSIWPCLSIINELPYEYHWKSVKRDFFNFSTRRKSDKHKESHRSRPQRMSIHVPYAKPPSSARPSALTRNNISRH